MVLNFFKWLWTWVIKIFIFIKTRLEIDDYYLVLNGNHEHILKRLAKGNKNDFSEKAQLALLERGNHKEIIALLHNKYTSLKVNEKIVERADSTELTVLCRGERIISTNILLKIIDYGYIEPIREMILAKPLEIFDSDVQEKIINLNNIDLTRLLVNKVHINDSNIVKLIEAGFCNIGFSNISKLIPISDCYMYSSKVFEAVVKNCYVDDVEYIVENFDLPESAALLLLERYAHNVDVMDEFLERKICSDKVQLEVIKKLSHEYVMKLILNNRLSDEACLAIIQNGNMEEIDKLITCKDYLSQEMIDALLVRNVHSEMVNLMKNQLVSNSVLEELVKRCRFDYIRLYLSCHETDPQFTQLLLIEILERTVKC